ncbi:MAG: hypothetical protein LN413_00430 [Candidatus Thermoplasmatota archaeon]|nr:hypothetical protein [Candidatus Thermoplasmatota archaeon]
MRGVAKDRIVKQIPNLEQGDVKCLRCGRTFHLYFNGGELDREDCCGLTYETMHQQIDLVIYKQLDREGHLDG